MNHLRELQDFGQSVWYDNIQRSILGPGGELEHMIREDGLRGVTSNPTIFEKAINGSNDYDEALLSLLEIDPNANSRELFFSLAIDDIRHAADQLRPVYDATDGADGYVSLEVSPDLAYDTDHTIAEAKKLWQRVDRPNLMIKVPSTLDGLPAIEALIAAGINVNATLLFSVERYEEVARAYIAGMRRRLEEGEPLNHIASVASFFVSRVDTLLDKLLDERAATADSDQAALIAQLKGQIAVANAKAAYKLSHALYSEEFLDLEAAGARPQRLLWASTGTKNPDYSDVLYVDSLIGPDTVNTMPLATYQAFKDHGRPASTLGLDTDEACRRIEQLKELEVDLAAATQQLEDEGVAAFDHSFQTLLAAIETKAKALRAA